MIHFDNTYAKLANTFYAKQHPGGSPAPELVAVNDELAAELGIDSTWLRSKDGIAFISGNSVVKGSEPLAQAYAGHQFGGFSPQLGDGRALLLGEIIDKNGKRRDIQLKGCGRTPFSRNGDGKSALGPVIREYLVSEAMHALGVPTTRALAAIYTGENVRREEPQKGGIFTRVASSHLRIGTFEYFAARQDHDSLKTLLHYTLERHYPESLNDENLALSLLRHVISAQALLVAKWMQFGFIHGVMNTDNVTISGETIDFGPCAFMDTFHPNCVFSAIDRDARYSWINQPSITNWNLTRLAETLLPLISEDIEEAKSLAEETLAHFSKEFKNHYHDAFRNKLGLSNEAPTSFINDTLSLLTENEIDFTLFFRYLTSFASNGDCSELNGLFARTEALDSWLIKWREFFDSENLPKMRQSNPILIPRNHHVEEAIQAAYRGDYSVFHRLREAWKHPYAENSDYSDLEAAPLPHERVFQTFCGT